MNEKIDELKRLLEEEIAVFVNVTYDPLYLGIYVKIRSVILRDYNFKMYDGYFMETPTKIIANRIICEFRKYVNDYFFKN